LIGTIINCAAVLAGTTVGLALKGGIPQKLQDGIMHAVGLSTIFIGCGGALAGLLTISDGTLGTRYTMLMVLSLVLGAVIGELLNIDDALERLGEWIKKKVPAKLAGSTFVDGFVSASMLFCVGAMAIVGALEDGLNGDYSILSAKSVLDGISSIVFSASLGIGTGFAVFPLLIYQGGITLLAQAIKPYLTDELISQMSCVGSILIFAIGINLIFGKKIKVANLLPAIFLPIVFTLIKSVWPAFPV